MRKIFLLFLLLGLLVIFDKEKSKDSVRSVVPTPTLKAEKPIVWWRAKALVLKLLDNTEKMDDSRNVATEAGCIAGINAFYYDKSNNPLGVVIVDGKPINKYHKSNLLSGYVYIKNNRFFVSNFLPDDVSFAHQAGPILITDGKEQKAKLESKNLERRSVAVQTEEDEAVFVWVEDASLANLPEILIKLGEENGFRIKNAINLDGGNSSVIWTEDESRRETFFAGGFWCQVKVF